MSVFHLVCRQCTREELFERGGAAELAAFGHQIASGHETAVGRVV